MDNTSSIPGLTFHVESADYKDSAMFAAKGTVHLSVDIEDLDVWEEVLHRLDGMRVHAVDDFHRQLMTSLQQGSLKEQAAEARRQSIFETWDTKARRDQDLKENDK